MGIIIKELVFKTSGFSYRADRIISYIEGDEFDSVVYEYIPDIDEESEI